MRVSILIPTLNAGNVLEPCLRSIAEQNFDKNALEIIIGDGGSTDDTIDVAKKYGAIVVNNPLKTGESGKMAALKHARGHYIALIDSDNILPTNNWLTEMIEPLEKHPEAVGSEPWSYTWRAEDGFISRYCALIGMNDPLVSFLGNYDRANLLTGKWTEVEHTEKDHGPYLVAIFNKSGIPTIGANGTVFRSEFLKSNASGDYLFDIDIIVTALKKSGQLHFIKVKNGIIHTYCESDVAKFARKQRRRVKDYLFHKAQGNRSVEWVGKTNLGYIKFIIYCLMVFPLFIEALIGFCRKPDLAWLFHPLACEITLWEYSTGVISGLFNKSEADRSAWKQ